MESVIQRTLIMRIIKSLSDTAETMKIMHIRNMQKKRGLPISPNTFNLLQIYLAEYADLLKYTDYLFVAEAGATKESHLPVNSVYSIFDTLEKHSGINAHPHQLRHYFANERRKSGWDM